MFYFLFLPYMLQNETFIISSIKKAHPFLTDEDVKLFLTICQFKKIKKKDIVIDFNEKSRTAFIVFKGMVRGYVITEEGEEKNVFLSIQNLVSGSPNALLEDAPSLYRYEAISDVELITFNLDDCEALAFQNKNIFKFYISAYKATIKLMVGRIESMINKQPEQRYEELLESRPEYFQFAFQKDIANFLGITPVSLSRIVKRKINKEKS